MARQQLTEAVGIAQPLNRIAGALGRPGDDLRVERLLRVPPSVLAAPRRTEPAPGERSGEPTSPTATLSYYPLPPGTSAASLAAAAGDRMSYEWHLRGGRFD